VAEHFQDSHQEMVFEILNEPHNALLPKRWNIMQLKALHAG
jgi:aryl-phospho-beta-D-glucosidase BglC (GH1 family)